MSERREMRAAIIGATVVFTACAHAPMFVDGTWEHPRLTGVLCEPGDRVAAVNVSINDSAGAQLPGVSIYLLPRTSQALSAAPVVSDAQGHAKVQLDGGSGVYFVVAALAGFDLGWHSVLLEPGCRGDLTFVLQVAMGPK
jgi:hypothetical protein